METAPLGHAGAMTLDKLGFPPVVTLGQAVAVTLSPEGITGAWPGQRPPTPPPDKERLDLNGERVTEGAATGGGIRHCFRWRRFYSRGVGGRWHVMGGTAHTCTAHATTAHAHVSQIRNNVRV